jgi:formylglycine-generating enzyme required for sulfatase activity
VEVTNAEYRVWKRGHDSGDCKGHSLNGDRQPVAGVSWDDASGFAKWLTEREGRTYRLPTEAEWEYACRAGTTTPFSFGDTISTEQANYDGRYAYGSGREGVYRECSTDVGTLGCNAWGLFDMHGNAWEWCSDWYADSCADWFVDDPRGRVKDPFGPTTGSVRVLRGGSWYDLPWGLRSACRTRATPAGRLGYYGFRLVSPLPEGE